MFQNYLIIVEFLCLEESFGGKQFANAEILIVPKNIFKSPQGD